MEDKRSEALTKGYEDFFHSLDSIKECVSLDKITEKIFYHKKHWIERLKNPSFPIAFLGAFSSGKSTTINAIIGRYILPENMDVATSVPTILKKGAKDFAIVYYLNAKGKEELFKLYLDEMAKILDNPNFNLNDIESLNGKKELVAQVEKLVNDVKKVSMAIDEEPLDKLKQIINNWERFPKAPLPIDFNQLEEHITKRNSDILFVDKVEITVSNIELDDDIELVDLPGLGVQNIRHQEITKEYILKKANAFVVCIRPMQFLEGEEKTFLDKVNQENPSILKRAFWLLNQWDTIKTDKQIRETNLAFEDDIKSYFINPKRIFRVSSLHFLLLQEISQKGELQGILKEHEKMFNLVPDLEAAKKQLLSSEFYNFRMDLFAYLKEDARNEFYSDAQRELNSLQIKYLDYFKSEYESCLKGSISEYNIISRTVRKEINDLTNKLLKITEIEADNARAEILGNEEYIIWDNSKFGNITTKIEETLENPTSNKRLGKIITKGLDVRKVFSRLPKEIEAILPTPFVLRKELENSIEQLIFETFSRTLLYKLKLGANKYLTTEFENELNSILQEEKLRTRVRGLCDYLFYDYGDRLDMIGINAVSKIRKAEFQEDDDLSNIISAITEKLTPELLKTMIDYIGNGQKADLKDLLFDSI